MDGTNRANGSPTHYLARKGIPYLAGAMGTDSRKQGSLAILGDIPHQLHIENRNRRRRCRPINHARANTWRIGQGTLLFRILPARGFRSMVKVRLRNCGPIKTRPAPLGRVTHLFQFQCILPDTTFSLVFDRTLR